MSQGAGVSPETSESSATSCRVFCREALLLTLDIHWYPSPDFILTFHPEDEFCLLRHMSGGRSAC